MLNLIFQQGHLALVAGMTNNFYKFQYIRKHFSYLIFSNDRKSLGQRPVCHFHLSNIVSIVSISAEKLMDLEGLHCNILIQALHHLLCIVLVVRHDLKTDTTLP